MMPIEIANAIFLATKTNYKDRTQTISKFNADLLNENFSDKIDEFVESTLGMNNPSSFKEISIAFEMPDDEIAYLFESYYDSFVSSILCLIPSKSFLFS